ncbi:uncharacterized protein LOC144448295 [Glandiceps talaboti]
MKTALRHTSRKNRTLPALKRKGQQRSRSGTTGRSQNQVNDMTVAEVTRSRGEDNSRRVMQEGRQRRLKRKMIDTWLSARQSVIRNEYHYRTQVLTDSTLHIPLDPLEWSTDDVKTWLQNMADQFGIQNMPYEHFQMNGKGLCIMPTDGFSRRVPEKGHLLKKDFYRRLKESRTGLNLKKNANSIKF